MPGLKRKTQEVKGLIGMLSWSIIIFAVDNLCLIRVHFQFARFEPLYDLSQDEMRLVLCAAMGHDIIGVAFEGDGWILLGHPRIECMMQEYVGQQRADYPSLGRPSIPRYHGPIFAPNRRLQPALNVEQNPLAVCVLAYCAHH